MKPYKFKSHSAATKFMVNYYVNMCGYKLFDPTVKGGVFAVASKADRTILTLQDDKTIHKHTGRTSEAGFLTEHDYKIAHDEYADIAHAATQDE